MPDVKPTGKARREFMQKRKVVGPVVPLPKIGGSHARSPLTPTAQANVAKMRAQMRALLPGLWHG